MFDVDWDEAGGTFIPVGKIVFISKPPRSLTYTPVVYIVNKTLQKTTPGAIGDLAIKILIQVQYITQLQNITFNELQLDCDWTETTREKYFHLLSVLKEALGKHHQLLSATIRLHQVKYASITGIPPVNKGMLMYYNMGKLGTSPGPNSIFNAEDASRYVDYIDKYPLPLDAALPAILWGIHIRENKIVNLLNNLSLQDFKNNRNFSRLDSLQVRADSSTFFKGLYFKKNDIIKMEEINPDLCLKAAKQLRSHLPKALRTVAIFQLDSLMTTRYEEKNLEKIFGTFH